MIAPRRGLVAALGAACAAAWAGCGDAEVEAIGSFGPAGDGGVVFLDPDGGRRDGDAFCQGSGALVPLSQDTCVGDLGRRFFRFAVCSCTSGAVSGKLRTDSFYSPAGGGGAGSSASLAANGSWSTSSHTSIGGSVYTAGSAGPPALSLKGDGVVAGDVHAGADVTSSGTFQIGGDLFAAGNVGVVSGTLTDVGKIHLSPGRAATGVTAAGGTVTEPVSVPPPCDCGAALDVASIVSPFASANDDALGGVTAAALDHPAAPVALGCGRYYFDAIEGGDVTLSLSGRTAVFVAGDVRVGGALHVDLGPGAELDLFVAGSVSLTGPVAFGSPAAPAKVRVYSGGPVFELSGDAKLGANVYAPRADVAVSSDFEMSGALHARSVAFSGDLTIHYDESVIDTIGCRPPGGACATCNDCPPSTPACRGGACVPCVTNADCCAPLVCNTGTCVAILR